MRQSYLPFVMFVAVALVGCAPSVTAELEANKEVARRFVEAGNAGDWNAVAELLTEDFQRHSQATPGVEVNSRDDFVAFQQSSGETFSDQHVTSEMLIAEGDKVAAYCTYTATQTGPMDAFPATGKRAEVKFLTILRMEDGRIAEMWIEWDNVAFLTQLGHFPAPAQAAN